VEGTVFLTGDEAPEVQGKNFATCPDAAKTRGKLFRTSEEGALGTGADRKRPVADAIVAVTGYSGFYLPEREEAHRLVLEECSEVPRTVVMTFGQRLEIENKSKIIFAPQLMQGTVGALMVATPGAEAVKLYPARPGRYAIDDRLAHDTGTMDLYVLLQSAHGVSDRKGHYRIDGLPLGQLTVNARLAAISVEAAQPFEVKAGVVQHVDLILNYTKAVAPAASASASTSASGAGADAGAAASGPNAKTSPGVAPAKPVPALR
jgi:hypothetical protein